MTVLEALQAVVDEIADRSRQLSQYAHNREVLGEDDKADALFCAAENLNALLPWIKELSERC